MFSASTNWTRLVYVALVTLLATAAIGVGAVNYAMRGYQIEAVVRTSPEAQASIAAGPFFSADELGRAMELAKDHPVSPQQVQAFRNRLQVIRKQSQVNGGLTRVRFSTTTNPLLAQRIIDQLSQIAVHRLNAEQISAARQRQQQGGNARLEAARRQEEASRSALDHYVAGWLTERNQPIPRDSAAIAAEPAQMVNPRWEALARKRDRLELRLEELLETHRRSHPVVQRLQSEIERVQTRIAETQSTLPDGSPDSRLGVPRVERPTPSPTYAIAADHQRESEAITRQQTYARLRAELEAARANRLRIAGEIAAAPTKTVLTRSAWIERPATLRQHAAPDPWRIQLVLAASLLAAITMTAGQLSLDRFTSNDEDPGREVSVGPPARRIHAALILLFESVTALVAIAAVIALSLGETSWLTSLTDRLS